MSGGVRGRGLVTPSYSIVWERGEWMVGLVLLAPEARGQGLGKGIHAFLCEQVRRQDGRKLLIGVVESNRRAMRFWQSAGYREVARVRQATEQAGQTIIVMQHEIRQADGPKGAVT